ncbi:MAG: hypothetical protein ABI840_07255 [bacterium]
MVTNKDIPSNFNCDLEKYFNKSAVINDAIGKTTYKDSYDSSWGIRIIYAYDSHDKVYLIFSIDKRTIKIHVENAKIKDKIDLLVKNVNETFEQFKEYLNSKEIGIKNAKSYIYSENSHLITGEYITKKKRILGLLKEDIPLKIYIPVVTLLMSYLLGNDLQKSFFNAIIAFGAAFVWLLIETLKSRNELKYSINKIFNT